MSSLTSTFFSAFLVNVISYGMSVATLNIPDFLRIDKDPLFGSTVRFGLFEMCIEKGSFQSCKPFPSPDCKVSIPDGPGDDRPLTFCEAWLWTRYLQVVAVVFFGTFALCGWMAMVVSSSMRRRLLSVTLLCTGLHGMLQMADMVMVTKLRQDAIFYMGGAYGTSFLLQNMSYGLDLLLFVGIVSIVVVRRSAYEELMNGRIYAPIL